MRGLRVSGRGFWAVSLGLNIIYLAKQCGIGTFIGTAGNITGYAVDGRGLLRLKARFDKRVWRTSPRWAGQRHAAEVFSAASVIAGGVWRDLPVGMKRLCDAGAFNRIVGTVRMLVEEGGEGIDNGSVRRAVVGDVDGLRGLDLSVDSVGPHRVVKSAQRKVKSGDGGFGFRLTGMDVLFREMDAALGDGMDRKAGKYWVAQRFYSGKLIGAPTDAHMGSLMGWGLACARLRVEQGFDVGELMAYYGGWEFGKAVKAAGGWRVAGNVLRMEDGVRNDISHDCLVDGLCKEWVAGNRVFSGLGQGGRNSEGIRLRLPGCSVPASKGVRELRPWDFVWEEKLRVCGYTRAMAARIGGWQEVKNEKRKVKSSADSAVVPERRFRVWVHAVELGEAVWRRGRYELGDTLRTASGFVTDWVVCNGEGPRSYVIKGSADLLAGTGVVVVFTGVEVAEKRGRHWVRLPWCCKVRVADVVYEGQANGGDAHPASCSSFPASERLVDGHSMADETTGGQATGQSERKEERNWGVAAASWARAGP